MLMVIAAIAVSGLAVDVPLPRPRPVIPEDAGIVSIETPHGPPTDCDRRLGEMAVFEPKPTMAGPGECGADDLVSLSAVLLPEGRQVKMQPSATLRCEMAESLSSWVRDEVAPQLEKEGGGLAAVQQEDAYDCRNRNSAAHGKVSEHAHGKAIDLRGFVLADKSTLTLTDVFASKDLRTIFHDTACRRFMTVLGPGEPYHDEHIHLDIIERRGGHRICSWAVREPPPPPAPTNVASTSAVPAESKQDKAKDGAAEETPLQRHAALSPDLYERAVLKAAESTKVAAGKAAEEEAARARQKHHKRKRRP
jgi:Extensin-like protein C-terminus